MRQKSVMYVVDIGISNATKRSRSDVDLSQYVWSNELCVDTGRMLCGAVRVLPRPLLTKLCICENGN